MASSLVLDGLDDLIRRRSILRHPFYRAWEEGTLTRQQIATYARIYYPHVSAFPRCLNAAIEHAQDAPTRDELEDNLRDELGNPAPHDALWLDFAAGMGADPGEVAGAEPHPAAANLVSTFERLAKRSLASGLAALYAYESQQPDVSRAKADGLREHHGIQDAATLAYFEVHEAADVRHRHGERDALAACLEAGASAETVTEVAARALGAYWGLLDGVCEEIGLPA
jgi:pyrroloquinoline-quinone synthase